MRVLFLSPVGGLGGSERSLLDVLASLRASAPQVELGLVAGGEGPLLEDAAALGVEVISMPFPERLAVLGDSGVGGPRALARLAFGTMLSSAEVSAYVMRLRKVVRRFAPSVLHSNGVKMHVLSVTIGSRSQQVVWHVRDFIGERPVMAGVLRLASRRASLAIANSEAVGADVRAHLPGLRVSVIHNAIDTDVFSPAGASANLDELAGLRPTTSDTLRVGLVATYARWKGQDVFLAAAKRVLERAGQPVRFYVVGGPVYRTGGSQFHEAELRALAASLGVASQVGFVPFQRQPANVYRALDVVVHASTRPEPFGRTIVEAMSCARAVVVAGDGGALELFSDGVDALRSPPGDPVSLAVAVGDLLGDSMRRERLGAAARETAVHRFSRDRLGKSVLDAYSGAEKPRPRPAALV